MLKLIDKLMEKAAMDAMLAKFIHAIVNVLLLLFVLMAALDQLGVDTTSFIALIAAAGLAIGLALQGPLQSFASGVLLIVFRPFEVGHVIEVAGVSGKVKDIGIFSTCLKTGDNREITVSNSAIYAGNIINSSTCDSRRIDMIFAIGYDDDIRQAKDIMQQILAADERVFKEPEALIAVAELADCSVNFHVRPWVKSGDYWAVKFDVTEKIKLAFDVAGISIPYPQMDVHISKSA